MRGRKNVSAGAVTYTTRSKPWDQCLRFGCRRKTASSKPEKNPDRRLCRFHLPETEAVRRTELDLGRFKAALCTRGLGSACYVPRREPRRYVSLLGYCRPRPPLVVKTARRTCQTEADFYYTHHAASTCRYSTAAWKRKTIPWRFGDPGPADLWEGDEDE